MITIYINFVRIPVIDKSISETNEYVCENNCINILNWMKNNKTAVNSVQTELEIQ